MSQKTMAFLLNALISAFIGLAVGFTIMMLPVYQEETPLHLLLTSSFIGLIIGLVSRTSAILFHRYFSEKPGWVYGIVFLVTGLGTIASTYPFDQPFRHTVVMVAVAETLALLTTFFNLKYLKRLNEGLKRKQEALKQNIQ